MPPQCMSHLVPAHERIGFPTHGHGEVSASMLEPYAARSSLSLQTSDVGRCHGCVRPRDRVPPRGRAARSAARPAVVRLPRVGAATAHLLSAEPTAKPSSTKSGASADGRVPLRVRRRSPMSVQSLHRWALRRVPRRELVQAWRDVRALMVGWDVHAVESGLSAAPTTASGTTSTRPASSFATPTGAAASAHAARAHRRLCPCATVVRRSDQRLPSARGRAASSPRRDS